MKKKYTIISLALLLAVTVLTACSIKYGFTSVGGIDYSKTKTISIDKFPIRANYVWSPMESMFYNELTDAISKKTKLSVLKRNGDLQLSGEITEYSQTNKAISSDGFSSQVQLRMTVNVRYVNNKEHKDDFEQRFSATTTYPATQQLSSVQEDLVQEMIEDIVDQIFNATVGNW